MPLVALEHISHAYGHVPLLDDVGLQVDTGERISIIGRNGSGKSTLVQIIAGDLPPDRGTVWRQPGTRVARLVQDVPLSANRTVAEVVGEGLGTLDQHDEWQRSHQADMVMSRLQLQPDVNVDTLSGGWKRRVLLARALVGQPELLLLDEPTNHLDIEAITWLESFLAQYQGAVMFVTHDRAFLERLATRIVEIDRGHLTSWPGDYATFERKREEWLASEELQRAKFDKKMATEEVWLRRGVKARRTRDEGRVKALMAMRAERAARRNQIGQVRLQIEPSDVSGKMVFEANDISFSYVGAGPDSHVGAGLPPSRSALRWTSQSRPSAAGSPVIRDFSIRVMRGDRIGLIGPNGAGKTTFLKLLLGELAPATGEIRRGANVEVAYYDQQREQLDPDRSVVDTIGDGNDTVTVNRQPRHVHGYLQDFLFSPERARSPVKALSGGERNRLLLARLFTRPATVLVLDEPTNDLDLETLELLEQQLVEWSGTLLLVSHDRRFLDNVVTSTVVFEGSGRLQEYVGGYEDWLRQAQAIRPSGHQAIKRPTSERANRPTDQQVNKPPKKRSFKEEREYAELPDRITALETEQQQLQSAIADPEFYKKSAADIHAALERVAALEGELLAALERWDTLDSIGGGRV